MTGKTPKRDLIPFILVILFLLVVLIFPIIRFWPDQWW